MLDKITIYPKTKKDKDLLDFLSKYSAYPVETNTDCTKVKNSKIFISNYDRKYLGFDDSNEIILLSRNGQLSNKETLLLNSVDTIITHTRHEGFRLLQQLQAKGYWKHIVPLLPWCNPSKKTDGIHLIDANEQYSKALFGRELSDDPNSSVRVLLKERNVWPYDILEGMINGAIPIVLDRPPFNEFIIHGFNGFLVRHPGEVVSALRKIEDGQMWLTHNTKSSSRALLDPTRYLETLMNLKGAPGSD